MNRKDALATTSLDLPGLNLRKGMAALKANRTTEALGLLEQAANAGNLTALHNLGLMHYEGHGVPRDPQKGKFYWKKAAKQGLLASQYYLARSDAVEGRDGPAFRVMRKLAETDSPIAPHAQYGAAGMLMSGQGTPKDIAAGIELLKRSATAGHAPAQCALAKKQLEKDSDYYDPHSAVALLTGAQRAGNREAADLLRAHFPLPHRPYRSNSRFTPRQFVH